MSSALRQRMVEDMCLRGLSERTQGSYLGVVRQLAEHYLQDERIGHTLQPTALVHETFLRLGCPSDPKWGGRPGGG